MTTVQNTAPAWATETHVDDPDTDPMTTHSHQITQGRYELVIANTIADVDLGTDVIVRWLAPGVTGGGTPEEFAVEISEIPGLIDALQSAYDHVRLAPADPARETAEGWGPADATHMHVLLTEAPDGARRITAHRADNPDCEFCGSDEPRQERKKPGGNQYTFLGSWPIVASRDSDGRKALHTCARPAEVTA